MKSIEDTKVKKLTLEMIKRRNCKKQYAVETILGLISFDFISKNIVVDHKYLHDSKAFNILDVIKKSIELKDNAINVDSIELKNVVVSDERLLKVDFLVNTEFVETLDFMMNKENEKLNTYFYATLASEFSNNEKKITCSNKCYISMLPKIESPYGSFKLNLRAIEFPLFSFVEVNTEIGSFDDEDSNNSFYSEIKLNFNINLNTFQNHCIAVAKNDYKVMGSLMEKGRVNSTSTYHAHINNNSDGLIDSIYIYSNQCIMIFDFLNEIVQFTEYDSLAKDIVEVKFIDLFEPIMFFQYMKFQM